MNPDNEQYELHSSFYEPDAPCLFCSRLGSKDGMCLDCFAQLERISESLAKMTDVVAELEVLAHGGVSITPSIDPAVPPAHLSDDLAEELRQLNKHG